MEGHDTHSESVLFVKVTHLNQPGAPLLLKNVKLLKDHFFGGDAPRDAPIRLTMSSHNDAAAAWEAVSAGGLDCVSPLEKPHALLWRIAELVERQGKLRNVAQVEAACDGY